jgi:hypothetical protein
MVGHFLDSPITQIVSLLLYSIIILLEDFRGIELRRLDISTTFAIMIFLSSYAHLVALTNLVSIGNSWAAYLVPQYLERGLYVYSIGSFLIMESLRRGISFRTVYRISHRDPRLFFSILFVSAFILLADHFKILPRLGSISSFVVLIINGSVFLLSYTTHSAESQLKIYVLIIYTSLLSLYAIQYAYLRMEIVLPWFAYFSGEILARKKILNLHFTSKIVLLIGLIVYPIVFSYLGQNRASLSGRDEKLQRVFEGSVQLKEVDEGETILGRLNVLGQMSNVVSLTDRKGFYNGHTLSYFTFVFIPRFLWPEKPTLDAGQWFSVEIGRSYYKKSGKANNSINMTVPGEMYLNYGWYGLIIGCIFFGFFISRIWIWIDGEDLLSWTFRFYLLFLGMFSLGSDLMVIPQLVAYMLIYKGVLFIKKNVHA